jgi:Cu-Zn family superoxide dismutase
MLVAACVIGCGDDTEEASTGTDAGMQGSATADAGPVVDAGANKDATVAVASDASAADASTAAVTDAGAKSDAGAATDGGAAGDGGAVSSARATLESKSMSTTKGTGTFSTVSGKVQLVLNVSDAPAGQHGVHIHEKGDCSAADATSAGGHWNPGMHMHGDLTDPSTTHLGDLGNITISDAGVGMITVSNAGWTMGGGAATDVVGKAIVVHARADDLKTQANADAGVTPGDAGARIACGVITAGQ